jgi:nitrogen regulatory protein P-II 1
MGFEKRMKLISSLVRPDKVDGIKLGLRRVNAFSITVAHIVDHTPQYHGTTVWKGHEYVLDSSLKVEIEVVVDDDDVDQVIQVIMRAARTGEVGDGHVCVLPVDHRYDILTGRRGIS